MEPGLPLWLAYATAIASIIAALATTYLVFRSKYQTALAKRQLEEIEKARLEDIKSRLEFKIRCCCAYYYHDEETGDTVQTREAVLELINEGGSKAKNITFEVNSEAFLSRFERTKNTMLRTGVSELGPGEGVAQLWDFTLNLNHAVEELQEDEFGDKFLRVRVAWEDADTGKDEHSTLKVPFPLPEEELSGEGELPSYDPREYYPPPGWAAQHPGWDDEPWSMSFPPWRDPKYDEEAG
jgi:hypothetical protein